jgi:4-amino-4-deoxy-L-arabinose transferase-like glycosyltransferase
MRLSMLLGNSLVAIRLFPALAGAGTILLAGLIARALGGSRFAEGLASLSILLGMVFWVMFGYASPNAYDIFFVTLASYAFVRALPDVGPKWWIMLGAAVGLGLNSKLSMSVFACGLAAGLLLTSHRRLLRTPGPYIAAAIGLVMVAPQVIWQAVHGWPTLEFILEARQKNLDQPTPVLLWQIAFVTNPFLVPLWIAGAWGFVRAQGPGPGRALGIAILSYAVVYLLAESKFYYFLPVIPALFAAGAVTLEGWTAVKRRWVRAPILAPAVLLAIVMLPFGLPILPIESFASYANFWKLARQTAMERHDPKNVPGYFGQRIGWAAFVDTVASVYHSLPDSERAACGIMGFHYGESGAIDYFGPARGLPESIGRHESFWLWGPRDYTGEIMILLMSGETRVEGYFRSVELRTTYTFPYTEGSFGVKRIYVCRDPVAPLREMWPSLKEYR